MTLSPEDNIEIAKIFRTEINHGCVCGYLYVCVATDTWQRAAIATWA